MQTKTDDDTIPYSCPRVQWISRGKIMADRKLYAVDVKYPHDRKPIRVYFNGPSCGVGPVFLSCNGINTTIANPERFGAFDREYPRRFFAKIEVRNDA